LDVGFALSDRLEIAEAAGLCARASRGDPNNATIAPSNPTMTDEIGVLPRGRIDNSGPNRIGRLPNRGNCLIKNSEKALWLQS
jgi:hypothetical protein